MKTFRILFMGVGLLLAVSLFVLVEASPANQEDDNEPTEAEIVITSECTQRWVLSAAPKGVSGFEIEVPVKVIGETPETVEFGELFQNQPVQDPSLQLVRPVQAMLYRVADFRQAVQAGSENITLLITPCEVRQIIIHQLDDDDPAGANSILPPGTIIRR